MSEQRVIRFRCWHLGEAKMAINPIMLYDKNPGDCLVFVSQGQNIQSVMQFTGLLDKNGKEIYEGDVLHISGTTMNERDWKAFVEWGNSGFVLVALETSGGRSKGSGYGFYGEPMTVIGNVYEHPHLLTDLK